MKKIYIPFLCLLFLLSSQTYSQVNYSFAPVSGTFTQVTGGTTPTLVSPDPGGYTTTDEGYANSIPIGFNFNYNGTAYTTFNMSANGFITFGAPFVADPDEETYFNSLTAGTDQAGVRPIVAPLWDDMDFAAESNMSYLVTGAAGSRVLTVEWANALWRYTATAGSITFQVKLFETTNIIEFHYRPEAGATGTPSASIGITAVGTGPGNFMSVQNTTSTATASTTTEVTNLSAKPASGQIFRFTPVACTAPSNLQTSSVTSTSATLMWDAVPGASAGYEYANGTSATPPASGTPTNSTSANISGLTPNVINYLFVRSNCGSSYSLWTTKAIVPCTNNTAPANGATNVPVPTTISWTAVTGSTGYTVMLSIDGGLTYTNIGTLPAPNTSAQINSQFNTTYNFYVRPVVGSDTASTSCQSNATSFTTVAPPPTPTNDECATAIAISPYSGTVNGYSISATASAGVPVCATDPGTPDDDVWYRFTALQNGNATITVVGGTSFDGVLQAFSGTCGSLTQFGTCADLTVSGGTEVLNLTGLVAGQTYYMRVYDWSAGTGDNFTITATGVALPVTVTNFKGEKQVNSNRLSWTSQTEQNNKGFEVERSVDGRNFTGLSFIASKAPEGNSTSAINYEFVDGRPFSGDSYYRLKQVDKDGKSTLSNVVLLKGSKVGSLTLSSIYPNPVKDKLNIVAAAPANDKVTFVITDLAGRIVGQQNSQVVTGDNIISINVNQLSAGSYMIKAVCANGCETEVKKFVKH